VARSEDIDVQRVLFLSGRFFLLKGRKAGGMKIYKMFLALTIVLLMALSGQTAMAQSTIFNIPTTDTVAQGSAYFEFDYFGQMPGPDLGDRYHIFMPRAVVGVVPNVEAGVNFNFTHTSGFTQSYIQPNLKWKFASSDEKGLAGSLGGILFAAMNNRSSTTDFGLVYGNFSKKVTTGDFGPRFTAGPYGTIGRLAGPEGGVVLGYEQPIHARASIVADWFSGKNYFGYFTPGVSFVLPRSGLLNVGYSIGNDSWENDNATKNRFLFIYYGVTF
jgi:hypothetical protein